MGQVPIDAVSKLREIFRVFIGDSAEEWETQKQQSEFSIKTDLEWTAHLLSIHRRYCTANDGCNLPHYQSNDLSSHTLSWDNKPPSPVPVSAPIPSQHRLEPNVSSAATKANNTGLYQRPHLPRRVPYSFNRHAQRRRGGTSKSLRYRSNLAAKPSSSTVTTDTVNTEASTSRRIVESEETDEDVIIIKEEPGCEYEEASTEDMYEGVAEYGRAGHYNERVSGESYAVGVMPGFSESEAECDPEDFGVDGDGVSVKLEGACFDDGMDSKVEEMDGGEQQRWSPRTREIRRTEGPDKRVAFSCTKYIVLNRQHEIQNVPRYATVEFKSEKTEEKNNVDIVIDNALITNERTDLISKHGADRSNRHDALLLDRRSRKPDHRRIPSRRVAERAITDGTSRGRREPTNWEACAVGNLKEEEHTVGYDKSEFGHQYDIVRPSDAPPGCRCDICGSVISSQSNMARHRRIHMGIKPYRCTVCYRGFTDRSNFVKHVRVVHNNACNMEQS